MADHPAEERPEGAAATESYDWPLARMQMLFAIEGLAENQCQQCGAFRLDALPPVLHRENCSPPAPFGRSFVFDFRGGG